MRITVEYPSTIDVVLAGKRNPERLFVWRRVTVEVREVETPIEPVVAVTDALPQDDLEVGTRIRFAGVGTGLLSEFGRDEDLAAASQARTVYCDLFGVRRVEQVQAFDHLPAVRSMVRDWGEDQDLEMLARAARCVCFEGRLFRPASEPYFWVDVDRRGRYQGIRVAWWTEPQPQGHLRAFPIDQIDAAIEVARQVGASDIEVASVRRRHVVTLYNRQALTLDRQRVELAAAARILVEAYKDVLNRLPIEKITIWARLRDGFEIWRNEINPGLDRLLPLVETAYEALQDEDKLAAGVRRDIGAVLAAVERPANLDMPFGGLGG